MSDNKGALLLCLPCIHDQIFGVVGAELFLVFCNVPLMPAFNAAVKPVSVLFLIILHSD